ncbi:MAG: 50S ribosomal protein L35 [Chloroflexi bacterium]|nr:50S ribosomal protein L35 [Chloroflexota bacterium]MBI4198744.1 50S ribosomal protein L35 [Chloroflexota bacterium]
MPKLKTHKGAKARFKFSGSGKTLRMKRMSSHLRRNKAKRTRRMFDDTVSTAPTDIAKVHRLLPYG